MFYDCFIYWYLLLWKYFIVFKCFEYLNWFFLGRVGFGRVNRNEIGVIFLFNILRVEVYLCDMLGIVSGERERVKIMRVCESRG